jgi:hypothetical protein
VDTLPSLVFEYLKDLNLMVLVQGTVPPTDQEWDAHIRAVMSAPTDPPFRVLVVSRGAHPSRAQQQRLIAQVRNRKTKVAVVTSAIGVRFVVSILALMNPHMRSFQPEERGAALQYLGLTQEQAKQVSLLVDRLATQITLPNPLVA